MSSFLLSSDMNDVHATLVEFSGLTGCLGELMNIS